MVIAIGTDNVDSIAAWCERMGTSFPVGGDFWPHGQVALRYRVFRPEGIAERSIFLIDKQGKIRFKELYPNDLVPPVEPVLKALRKLTP